jgi:hypothetical protein
LSSLAELEEAAQGGRLQKIKGLGASLQTKILRGIEMQRAAQGRRHMHRAAELLKTAEKHLREARPDIIRITAAGDFRRGCELVGDLSLVAEVSKLPSGPSILRAGGQLTAHLSDTAHYGITLLLAPGSDAHLAGLRAIAADSAVASSLRLPARTASIERLACSLCPGSCARAVAKWPELSPEHCRSLSPIAISLESSMRIRNALTVSTHLRRWQRPL